MDDENNIPSEITDDAGDRTYEENAVADGAAPVEPAEEASADVVGAEDGVSADHSAEGNESENDAPSEGAASEEPAEKGKKKKKEKSKAKKPASEKKAKKEPSAKRKKSADSGKSKKGSSKKSKTAEKDEKADSQKGKKSSFQASRSRFNLILVAISIAIFAVTLGIQYTFTNLLVTPKSNEVINWIFVTGKSDSAVNSAGTYFQAEANNRVSKPLTDQYFHGKYTLDGSSELRQLRITALFSPMKILIDGEEAYNNGYGEKSVVGNSYNEVTIPASDGDIDIEVFAFYPFAFNFRAYITPLEDTSVFSVSNVGSNFGIQLCLMAVLAGLLLLVGVFAMMFRSRDVVNLVGLSVVVMFSGGGMLLREIAMRSAVFKSYLFLSASEILTAIAVALGMLLLHLMMNEQGKRFIIADLLIPLFSLAFLVPNMYVMRIGGVLTAVAAVAAGAFLIMEMHEITNLNVTYSSILHIVGLYFVVVYAFTQAAFSIGFYAFSAGISAIALIVFSIMTYYIYARKIAQKRLEDFSGFKQRSEISYIFNAVSEIISSHSGFTSTREYAVNVCERTASFLLKSELLVIPDGLTCCAAMKTDDGFREIYNFLGRSDAEYDYQDINDHLIGPAGGFTIGTSFVEMKFGRPDTEELLIIFGNTYYDENSDFAEFMETLFKSIGMFFDRFNRSLENTDNIENIYMNLASLAESRCFGTENHLVTVSRMTKVIAEHMGFEDDADFIGAAAILHDVGKITVPSDILDKKAPLDLEETKILRQHVITGYNILSGVKGRFFDIARAIVLQHHENWDGTGYLGLSGEEISVYARMVKIVDVFDALVSDRSYKEKWSYERAITYIMERSGTEFDPEVVRAFMECGMELIEIKDESLNVNKAEDET